PVEQPRQLEPAPHPKHGTDVPVRQRALDLERVGGRQELLAPQRAAHQLDRLPRQAGEVGERLVSHLAALPVAAAKQVRLIHAPLILPLRRYYMNSPTTPVLLHESDR